MFMMVPRSKGSIPAFFNLAMASKSIENLMPFFQQPVVRYAVDAQNIPLLRRAQRVAVALVLDWLERQMVFVHDLAPGGSGSL
jgi:hypothetical protein